MLYIYLAWSGDLNFNFGNKKSSGYFTICALVFKGQSNDRAIASALMRTGKCLTPEEGSFPLETLNIFHKRIKGIEFGLFASTLDKRNAYAWPAFDKSRLIAYLAGLVVEEIDFTDRAVKVTITGDRLGQSDEETQLSDTLRHLVQGRVSLETPLSFLHVHSRESAGLQATAIFARGFHTKHEQGDHKWHSVFKGNIRSEQLL